MKAEETDGQILDRMGTDALKWAEEWTDVAKAVYDRGGITALVGTINTPPDLGWMIGWFANAIEAGRSVGRRETCPHSEWLTLAQDLIICRTCNLTDDPSTWVASAARRCDLVSALVATARKLGWRNAMADIRPGEVTITFVTDDEPITDPVHTLRSATE